MAREIVMNPIVKSHHTHAGGEEKGWFGAGIHPALLDSKGHLVMGSEWRVEIMQAADLAESARFIDMKVTLELNRRWQEEDELCAWMHPKTKEVCNAMVPVVCIAGYLPTVVHDPKSGQHRLSYPEGVLRG